MTDYRALAGINYGPDGVRAEPGDKLPATFAPKKTIAALLQQGAVEEHASATRPSQPSTEPAPPTTPAKQDSAHSAPTAAHGGDSK
jgi:hypothetical protein